jgi:transcriptional activator SPT7
MSSEELILHTLFEHGAPDVQTLERYITDDVERYGNKLSELERKLQVAYQEQLENEADALEDDQLFNEEGDALMTMDFGELTGEDFFGFGALGLDKEFNFSSMGVPARLLRGGKKRQDAAAGDGRGPTGEPALAYPPPPPFVPLDSDAIKQMPALLRGTYQRKTDLLVPIPTGETAMQVDPPRIELPDDPILPGEGKIGPFGQVIATVSNSKKKDKGKAGGAPKVAPAKDKVKEKDKEPKEPGPKKKKQKKDNTSDFSIGLSLPSTSAAPLPMVAVQ